MKYIKMFEDIDDYYSEGNNQTITINKIMKYLGVEVQYPEDSVVIPVSKYDVDVIEYFKEIFVDKFIVFKSVDRPKNNPIVKGWIEDVCQLAYQDDFYIRVKIRTNLKVPGWNITNWYLINNDYEVYIYDSDADTKPLHKEVEIKKEAGKYNL